MAIWEQAFSVRWTKCCLEQISPILWVQKSAHGKVLSIRVSLPLLWKCIQGPRRLFWKHSHVASHFSFDPCHDHSVENKLRLCHLFKAFRRIIFDSQIFPKYKNSISQFVFKLRLKYGFNFSLWQINLAKKSFSGRLHWSKNTNLHKTPWQYISKFYDFSSNKLINLEIFLHNLF